MTVRDIKERFRIIGNHPAINQAVEIAMQVAPTDVTVLIFGENGSGKDAFSRIIHQNSRRRHESFIAINCGAIPEGTMDSELFGHEKGSFTSAYESRKGYFEEAEKGSIFLDEIGEMPLATQSRLLRLLENKEYLRVGSSKVLKSDVRVIAATNRNLVDMIRQGKFREDLYFRLNTVFIYVPPLRERGEDIPLLFDYFCVEFAEKYHREPVFLTPDATELLYKYRWPGNIREMRNLVEKLTVLVKGNRVTAEVLRDNLLITDSYLPSIIRNPYSQPLQDDDTREEVDKLYTLIYDLGKEVADLKKMLYFGLQGREIAPDAAPFAVPYPQVERTGFASANAGGYASQPSGHVYGGTEVILPQPPAKTARMLEESLSLEKKEKEFIIKALLKHGENRKKAAQELGISERTLYRKLKAYDIEP
jgi:transcriptional regulator with PAS, ATPase and Fis domain